MSTGLALQQDLSAKLDPSRLVDQWIEVEGLGLGRVVSFNKRSTMSPLSDSTHIVEFEQEPRVRMLVLRRRKLMSWNLGRRFRLVAAPQTSLATAPAPPDYSPESPPPTSPPTSPLAARPPEESDHILANQSQSEAEAAAYSGTDAATMPTTAAFPIARKNYSAFLSHFKHQAGTEARFVHDKLEQMMGAGNEIFLDSDLQDLRLLLEHVKASNVLVLLQTKSVLERPWVILELYTAIKHGVPIVALNISNAWPLDYGLALDFLTYFDFEIDVANPGAAQLLVEHGVDPVDVAHCLSTVLPSILSTDFNPNGSSNATNAAMMNLQAAMRRATPLPMTVSKEDWLAKRGKVPRAKRRSSKMQQGKGGEDLAIDIAHDPDSSTRIRGTLNNRVEVDVGGLSEEDALSFLLASASMNEEDIDLNSDDRRIALEILELCGRLPLALAIAGGMVAENGMGFSQDVLDVMQESSEAEDKEGLSLEERVIASSLKMMKGKNKALVETLFMFFATFPEDVPVPAAFFDRIAPLLSDDKPEEKARVQVGNALTTLLKYSLLKGSLLPGGQGVFIHGTVRAFVINQHSKDELSALQRRVVDTILVARPDGGFPLAELTSSASFEGYVGRHLWYHCRGALQEGGVDPPDSWLAHPDNVVRANVAMAVGVENLIVLSESLEEAGELVRAAQVSWTASKMNGVAGMQDLAYRSADLLERANDDGAREFENSVLTYVCLVEMGSPRNLGVCNRAKDFNSSVEATYESKLAECVSAKLSYFNLAGIITGEADDEVIADGTMMTICREAASKAFEAGALANNPSLRNYWANLSAGHILAAVIFASPSELWNPTDAGLSETSMVEAIDYYNFHVCSKALKQDLMLADWFRTGGWTSILALWYGGLEGLDLWHKKTLAAFEELDLSSSRNYENEAWEVAGSMLYNGGPIFILLGQSQRVAALLNSAGFRWGQDGFERIELLLAAHQKSFPEGKLPIFDVVSRLLMFLSSPKGTIDEAEVNAWIPSPQELADMEKSSMLLRRCFCVDVTSLGARAFLKLGRYNDAYELAGIAVSLEQKTEKSTVLVPCHSILGQVAAKRGNLDEADRHFSRALEEAERSRLPMLELLAARDWGEYLLEPNGRECDAAEAVIDGACAKMKKSREEMASVLQSSDAQSHISMGLSLLSQLKDPEEAEATLPLPPSLPKPTSPTRKVEDFTGHWRIFPGQISKGEAHLKALGVPYLVRAAICRAETQVNIIRTDGKVWVEKIMNSNLPAALVKTTQYNIDGIQQQLTNPMGGVCCMTTAANYEGGEVVNVTTIMEHPQKSITQTIVRTLTKDGLEMHVRNEMVLKDGRVLVRETDFSRLEEEEEEEGEE